MRNTLVSLFLIIFITSSANAETFLEAVDLSHHSMDYDQLVLKAKRHRWYRGNFLSLGESHLHPSTSRPVLLNLAQSFLEDTPLKKHFCSENIQGFLQGYEGREIQRLSDDINIFYNNDPSTTDFWGCAKQNSELTLVYSGFFHQHPFARNFPGDFAPTPVVTKPHNTIIAQMPIGRGLFVSLMELDHLEMTTSKALLDEKTTDIKVFRDRVVKLTQKIQDLRDEMTTVLSGTTPFRTKLGMVLERDHFAKKDVLPYGTYILLTELEGRKNNKPLKLLNDLIALSDQSLQKYLEFMNEERSFFTTALTEPNEDGSMYQTGYGTYPLQFPGGSQFLDLIDKNNKKSILLVSSPQASALRCLTKNDDVAIELDCEKIFFNDEK
ncbi:MAG: hypothetical protein EP319_05145 [Deltaproteobacteria bacterium]|nr:MAG: hypothetical protein EP319_05145 [Deltaproteobacteria bacterium]